MEVHILIPETREDLLEVRIVNGGNEKGIIVQGKNVHFLAAQLEAKRDSRWPDEDE